MPNNWRPYGQKITALENIFQPKVEKVIKDFRASFISVLQSHGHAEATRHLHSQVYPHQLPTLMELIYKRAGLIGALLQYQELKPFEAEARRLLAQRKKAAPGFGRNEQWVRMVIEFLRLHMVNILSDMTETMRSDILKILQKGIDDNLTIPEIVKNLKESGLIKARATLIARTEINKAANQGHRIAAQSTPYEVDKGWSAAKDERTRPGHRDVNGHKVAENDFFKVPIYRGKLKVGYEDMEGPGDPNATIGNLANCRCRRLYFPKRDADGNLILREESLATVIPMRQAPRYAPSEIAAILKNNIVVGVK
jgi:hypothetical protein